MSKPFSFFSGMLLLLMATIVPVFAQTSGSDDSELNIDINDFLTFAISNPAVDCQIAADGDCPFGSGAAAADLTPTGSNVYEISGDGTGSVTGVFTQLEAFTNSNDGYNVSAYADNAGGRTTTLLRSGGLGGTASDQVADSVQVLQDADGANEALTVASDTGVAFRLTDANTSSILREADEDTQWGETDDDQESGAAQALWAALPLGSGAARIVYDTDVYSGSATTAFINWFVGATSSQQTGTYTGTATFTASVN